MSTVCSKTFSAMCEPFVDPTAAPEQPQQELLQGVNKGNLLYSLLGFHRKYLMKLERTVKRPPGGQWTSMKNMEHA